MLVLKLHILGNVIMVYLIYFITCMALWLYVIYYICEQVMELLWFFR